MPILESHGNQNLERDWPVPHGRNAYPHRNHSHKKTDSLSGLIGLHARTRGDLSRPFFVGRDFDQESEIPFRCSNQPHGERENHGIQNLVASAWIANALTRGRQNLRNFSNQRHDRLRYVRNHHCVYHDPREIV